MNLLCPVHASLSDAVSTSPTSSNARAACIVCSYFVGNANLAMLQCTGRVLAFWRWHPCSSAVRHAGAADAQLHGAPPAMTAALFLMPVSTPAGRWTSVPCTCRSPSRNSGSLSQLGSFAEEHQSAANTLPEVSIRPGCQHLCPRPSRRVACCLWHTKGKECKLPPPSPGGSATTCLTCLNVVSPALLHRLLWVNIAGGRSCPARLMQQR